ncbi:MAG TPA: copper resistance protein CopC [Jatrophihabitans sp.]|nr:copper resistance protein CopC [Jatrophihabitans sp.]
MRLVKLALAVLVAGVATLLLAQPASAHAVVVGSTPTDGSRLKASPSSVTVRFDEPVGLQLGYLRVVDAVGRRVDTGTPSHPGGDGSQISVGLKSGLGDGTYLASFRIISADSHPVAGSIRWVVGNGALGAGGGPSDSAPDNQAVSSTLAASHWLSFAGVGVVGGSWLIFSLWPAGRRRPVIRRLVWSGWSLAVLGAVGEFVLQGPYAAGSGLGTALRGQLLDATLHVNSGQLLSVRLVLLGVLGFVLSALFAERAVGRRMSWAPEAAAMLGVGVVVTFAASGHSQSANPRWLAVLIDALHLTAMVVWLGGLVFLLVAAWPRRAAAELTDQESEARDAEEVEEAEAEQSEDLAELAAGLPVFSRIAMACVAVLAVTGTIQAWREIGALDAVTSTRYGQLVLVKVVLFAALIGLGYLARRVVRSPARALARLRRGLLTEVVVGAVVLAVTGVLIAQPPGKVALAADRAKPRSTTVAVTQAASAVVEVDPGVHGPVQFTIQLTGPIKPTVVSASASLPAKQLGPIELKLQASGPNTFSASGVVLPSAGQWQVQVTVQTSQFDSTTAVATVRVY